MVVALAADVGVESVTAALLRIVERAHSLERILGEAVELTARRLRVDSCSAFVIDREGRLALGAAYGAKDPASGKADNPEAALMASRVMGERPVSTAQTETSSLLASPLIMRDEMVGALVVRDVGPREFSSDDIETLATICAQLVVIVENARVIEAMDRGERPAPRGGPRAPVPGPGDAEHRLQGVGASPGIAMGTAMFRRSFRSELSSRELPAGRTCRGARPRGSCRREDPRRSITGSGRSRA
jgi:signal transduction protein with GAF and PtsI domain